MPPVSATAAPVLKSLAIPRRPNPSIPARWIPLAGTGLATRPSAAPVRSPRFPAWPRWRTMVGRYDEPRRRACPPAIVASAHHLLHAMGGGDHQRPDLANGGGDLKGASQNPPQTPRLLTLPTVLTLGRVAAVPLLVCTFYIDSSWSTSATTVIFLVAAVTDWLDGYIARKMKLGTAFGAFLDPVADKLMVAATLVMLCTRPLEVSLFSHVPWLLTIPSIAIIGREITMSAVREWAASQNSKVLEAVAVNNLGKWKTATQMVALTILLITRDASLTGASSLIASGVVLLYISAGLAVWSLGVYISKIWRVLLNLDHVNLLLDAETTG